jgi:hypothetical protein
MYCWASLLWGLLPYSKTSAEQKGKKMISPWQNHWVSELRRSSVILNTRKHNVSEAGSVSGLRWVEGDTNSLGFLRPVIEVSTFHGIQWSRCFPPFAWGQEQIQFPKRCASYYLEFRTMDKVQKPNDSEYWTVLTSSESFRFYMSFCSLLNTDRIGDTFE